MCKKKRRAILLFALRLSLRYFLYKDRLQKVYGILWNPVNGQDITHGKVLRYKESYSSWLKASDLVSLHIILYFQIHAAFSISVEAARFVIEKKPCICFMTHRLSSIFVLRRDLGYHAFCTCSMHFLSMLFCIPYLLYSYAYPYLCLSSASPQRFSYICTEPKYSIRSNRKTTASVKRLIGSSVFVRITRSMA